MTFLRLSVFLFILSLSVAAYPASHNFPCAKAKDVMKLNFTDGYAYLATAIEDRGFVIQLFIKPNGDWRVVGIDDKINGCILLHGVEFTFLQVRGM